MIDASVVLQQLVNGIMIGGIYSLGALGLSIIWGIMGLINFAHGELFMLGAYSAYFTTTLLGFDPISSTIFALAFLFIFGLALQKTVIKQRGLITTIIVTLGLSTVLQQFAQIVFGVQWLGVPTTLTGRFEFFGLIISHLRLTSFLASLALILILMFFIKYSKTGMAMRAVAQNRDVSLLMGIDVSKINALTWAVGAGLIGAAGSLLAPIYLVYPTVGSLTTSRSFAIVILSGLGSIKGTAVAGIIIGIIEALTTQFIGSAWKEVAVFLVIILTLVLRPAGLFGVKKK